MDALMKEILNETSLIDSEMSYMGNFESMAIFKSRKFTEQFYTRVVEDQLYRALFGFDDDTKLLDVFTKHFCKESLIKKFFGMLVSPKDYKIRLYIAKSVSIPDLGGITDVLYISSLVQFGFVGMDDNFNRHFIAYKATNSEDEREWLNISLAKADLEDDIKNSIKAQLNSEDASGVKLMQRSLAFLTVDVGVLSNFKFGMDDIQMLMLPDIAYISAEQYNRLKMLTSGGY